MHGVLHSSSSTRLPGVSVQKHLSLHVRFYIISDIITNADLPIVTIGCHGVVERVAVADTLAPRHGGGVDVGAGVGASCLLEAAHIVGGVCQ